MKILIVCSGNKGFISPFITDQAQTLEKSGVVVEFFVIEGKGTFGYLKNLPFLKQKIALFDPDLIHAHYGLSGLLSILQYRKKVVITFHGSDAYIDKVRFLSGIASRLSSFNIFVENNVRSRINVIKKNAIIPCGIDLDKFFTLDQRSARDKVNLSPNKKYILFSSGFDNPVKNYSLARDAVKMLNEDITIIELKDKTREEVNLLLNACGVAILTSKREGSPQFIKEAMACGVSIVATDVGDIKETIGKTDGCFVTSFEPDDVAEKIRSALSFSENKGRTIGRDRILELGLDSEAVAKKIIEVYEQVAFGRSGSLSI